MIHMNISEDSDPGSLPQHIHIIGIGGAGLSGSARLLVQRGHRVTGFDRASSSFLDALGTLDLESHVGDLDRPVLGSGVGLVVRSAAVPDEDPDCVEARRRGIPIWKYSRLLRELAPAGRTLAVAGTHGKTSVSWLLAYALRGLEHGMGGTAPRRGFLIGGSCQSLGVNSAQPEPGGWFALEACEYDRSFLQFSSTGAIITNLEADHLDYYGSLEAIEHAFARFVDRIDPEGLLVVGRDVPERVTNSSRAPVWRLGREIHVTYLGESRGRFRMKVRGPGWSTPPVELGQCGEFQVENAALAIALAVGRAAREWHLDPEMAAGEASRSLERFHGAARRFESWGSWGEIDVIHDYAHHPTEVRVTLEAAQRAFPNRSIHVLFQPHQHSRTARFLDEFVESLRGVDHVVVSDVYGARAHIDGVTAGSEELARRLTSLGGVATAGGDLARSIELCMKNLPDRCALLVLGAGDVDTIRDDLTRELALRSTAQSRAGV